MSAKLQKNIGPKYKCKISIQLFKLYNSEQMSDDWVDLNYQQNFNNRQKCVQITDESRTKIGKNVLLNRLGILNNKIDFDWLNLSLTAFKLKAKSLF